VNLVSSPPTSGFTVARLVYLGFSPFAYTNGTLSYTNSMVDWIHHNADYTQWQFNVKPGLMWSNGQPVTADDILNNYSPKFALNKTFDVFNLHAEIASTTALNSSTAVFNLNKTDAHFQELAGQNQYTPVYSPSFIAHGPAYTGINDTLVGDGPFYPVGYHTGDTQMVLLRNQYYKPTPTVCELILSFVETDAQDPTYLLGGSADFGLVEPGAVGSMSNHTNLHLYDEHATFNEFLAYNTSIFPFSSLAFRQALAYGINLAQIKQQAYSGYATDATSAQGGVPPATTEWYNPNQPTYTYDQSKAMALLNSIGMKTGSDGHLQYSNGTDVSLTIWADSSYTGETLASGIISKNLESLGMKINAQQVLTGTLIGDSYQGVTRGGMILFQSGGPVFGYPYLDALPGPQIYNPCNPYPLWEPDAAAAKAYNANFSAIKATADPSLMKTYLNNIQAINAKELPDLILAYPDDLYVYSTTAFTNWPGSAIYGLNAAFNDLGFSQLTPVGTSTTSGSDNTLLYAGVVIVILIIVAIGVWAMRRRGPSAKPATTTAPAK
jgi:peptide/nickel transport system substrate-binding protein